MGGVLGLRGIGDGTFEDVTEDWGLDGVGRSWGALALDMEGDGDIDVIVSAMVDTNNSLFVNDGSASFARVDLPMTRPCAWGFDDAAITHSIAAGDFDLDGDLDLGLSNGMGAMPRGGCTAVLFNDGDGAFRYLDVGVRCTNACGASAADVDNDGWQDLLIGDLGPETSVHWNMGPPDYLDFDPAHANTVFPAQEQSMIGEPLAYDQDGDLDVLVTAVDGTAPYRNDGNRRFTDVTDEAGIEGIDPVMNTAVADVDSNGYPDLLVSSFWPMPDGVPTLFYLLLNTGDGTFIDATEDVGIGQFDVPIHGFAAADLNDDGAMDLVLKLGGMNLGTDGPLLVHLNRGPSRPLLAVAVGGYALNTESVGTKVEVVTNAGSKFRWLRRGESMGSTSGGDLLVGLGRATAIRDVIATFPDGEVQRTGPIEWADRMRVEIEHP